MQKIYIFEDSQQSTSGGGQKVSATLVDHLLTRGDVCITVFDTKSKDESFFRQRKDITLVNYWRPRFRQNSFGPSFNYAALQSLCIIISAVFAGLRLLLSMLFLTTSQNKVFYCPTKFGYFVALVPSLFYSIKLIMHIHNISELSISSRLFQWLLRMTANEVVCVSQTVYDSVLHPRKILIRNPVPKLHSIQRFRHKDIFYLGVVASFFPYKGHFFFLEVAEKLLAKYPQLEIHLYGDGPELESLSRQFRSEAIHFHGRLDNLDDIYAKLNVVVIPSLKPEAFSIVIPEAWSYGCLILASDVPAHMELINDGVNGRLFSTGDSKDLFSKLESLIQDSQEHKREIEGGRASLAKLECDNFALRLSQLILK